MIYSNRIILVFIFYLFVFVQGFAQNGERKVIAKIGRDEITKDEFLERFELTPQVKAGITGINSSLKKEVLFSIIAERLFAFEAE